MVLFVLLRTAPFVVNYPSHPTCRLGIVFSLALYSTKLVLIVPSEAPDFYLPVQI